MAGISSVNHPRVGALMEPAKNDAAVVAGLRLSTPTPGAENTSRIHARVACRYDRVVRSRDVCRMHTCNGQVKMIRGIERGHSMDAPGVIARGARRPRGEFEKKKEADS
ncbi:MAG: hypothetical protein GY859_22275 [Desulfobacterales bacterium]|nr:hypothetical protein [Desulfobacterales bacterium]